MPVQDSARVPPKPGERNMRTVWSDFLSFFTNIRAEIIGFFSGLFGFGNRA
jgi:hypothetical protein